jgi:putative membrane protein
MCQYFSWRVVRAPVRLGVNQPGVADSGRDALMKLGWFFLRWGLNAVALIIVAWILSGVQVTWWAAILAALLIGILNAVVAPIIRILTLPITIVTLGLFLLVINALLFWLASLIIPGFTVNGAFAVIVGSILYSIFTTIIAHFVKGREKAAEAAQKA